MIEFVCASHDEQIFNRNLATSPAYGKFVFTVIKGLNNVSRAYNQANPRKENLVVYVHHDVFLPDSFEEDLKRSLQRVPDDWGVLGVAGVKMIEGKKSIHGHVSDRGKGWGSPWNLPAEVETLDELLLITRGDLKFDENLDQDFYGADICMQARAQGRKVYAISAYCEHNSSRIVGARTEAFYRCQDHFRNKWIDHLPIATTCAIIS